MKTKYKLTPGKAGIYQDGDIHSIDYPDYARFVRVTGTNLDKINRIRIDLKSGEVAPDDAATSDVVKSSIQLSSWPGSVPAHPRLGKHLVAREAKTWMRGSSPAHDNGETVIVQH